MLPPYKGVNELLPVATIKAPYCETLLNFNATAGGIELRNGDSIYHVLTPATTCNILGLFTYGPSGGIFIALQDNSGGANNGKIYIYDVDANSIVYTSAAAASTVNLDSVFYDGTLFIFPTGDHTLSPGIKYNGSAWAAVGYTGAGNFYPIAGNIFNHRQYMPQIGELAYWYSPIDSPASGTCIKVDLSGIFEEGSELAIIASTTISETISSVIYQSFISYTGEVLFYTGDYPNADNWALVGRAHIAQPVDFAATIPYNGDTLILTDAGVVSLRDLFLRGSQQAASLTLSNEIQKSWTNLVKLMRLEFSRPVGPISLSTPHGRIKGVYDAINSRIIINFPRHFTLNNPDGNDIQEGNLYFIFDTNLQSWFLHQSGDVQGTGNLHINNYDMVTYKGKVLLASVDSSGAFYAVRIKEGRCVTGDISFIDKYVDNSTEIPYQYEAKFAPVPFTKDRVHTIMSIEPILQSDLYAQTNFSLIADFGRQTTGNQVVDALTTSVQKPLVNVGLSGANFAQVKVSGTTVTSKTVGLTLYGCNVQYEAGEQGSR